MGGGIQNNPPQGGNGGYGDPSMPGNDGMPGEPGMSPNGSPRPAPRGQGPGLSGDGTVGYTPDWDGGGSFGNGRPGATGDQGLLFYRQMLEIQSLIANAGGNHGGVIRQPQLGGGNAPNGAPSNAPTGVSSQGMTGVSAGLMGPFINPFDIIQQQLAAMEVDGLNGVIALSNEIKENARRKDVVRKILSAINNKDSTLAKSIFNDPANKGFLTSMQMKEPSFDNDTSSENMDKISEDFKGALDGLGDVGSQLGFRVNRATTIDNQLNNLISSIFKTLSDSANQIIGRIA